MINTNETIQEKLLRKGFWLYFFAFITAPLWYAIKIILSSELSVSEIWILYWVISLITLISAYNDLWFTEWIKYFLPKFIHENNKNKQKSIIIAALWLQTITAIIFWIIFYFWSWFIAENYLSSIEAKEIIKTYSLFFIIISIFQVNLSILSAIQNVFLEKLFNFLRWLFTLGTIILLIFFWYSDIESISWGFIFALSLASLISITHGVKNFRTLTIWGNLIKDKKFYKDIFSYSWVIFLSTQIWVLLSQIDMQMVLYMLWSKEAWYYTNYLSIITIPFVLLAPIMWFLLPLFSSLKSQNKIKDLIKLKEILTKYFFVIWIFTWWITFIFSKEISTILFGEEYMKSWEILSYSALFILFNFLLQINFWLLSWIWKASKRAKILSWALVLNFILNWILIKNIWVWWAALWTAIWWIFIYVMSEIESKKEFNFSYDVKFMVFNFIILLTSFTLLWKLDLNMWSSRLEMLYNLIIIVLWLGIIISAFNIKEIKNFHLQIRNLKK